MAYIIYNNDGTTVLTINNDTMRGDPAPGIRKSWSVKYIC